MKLLPAGSKNVQHTNTEWVRGTQIGIGNSSGSIGTSDKSNWIELNWMCKWRYRTKCSYGVRKFIYRWILATSATFAAAVVGFFFSQFERSPFPRTKFDTDLVIGKFLFEQMHVCCFVINVSLSHSLFFSLLILLLWIHFGIRHIHTESFSSQFYSLK